MTLIYNKKFSGPATHALVIGVGNYNHLPGGGGQEYPYHEGLGQLTSPPPSAHGFVDWLLNDYHNPNKPLSTIDLLISDTEDSTYQIPGSGTKNIERARFSRVKNAVNRWFTRGNKDQEHMLVFFFSGHGVSKGYATSLLMEDFGKIQNNPLEHAISFRELYEGMDTCQSRWQCYFIDACRKASPSLITRYNNFTGHPIIPGSAFLAEIAPRTAPIFYATIPGISAYGRTGLPSVFTDALIQALKGAGSNDLDEEGKWKVDTNTLNQGLDHLLRRILGDHPGMGQVISVDELVNFTLHYLKTDPIVPVTIGCKPQEANLTANLGYQQESTINPVLRPDGDENPWLLELELGDYHFFAKFPNQDFNPTEKDRWISPPFRKIFLEVN